MALDPNAVQRNAQLRPIASPVDTYVTPAPVQESPLRGIAEGLSRLDGGLSAWVQKNKAAQEEGDRLRGEAAFYADNKEGMAEGVRSGAIPAFASPEFRKGYKSAEGQALAGRFEQDFIGAYTMWEGKGSEDPQAFEEFFNGFVKDYVAGAGDDPDVLRGFLPQFRATAEQVRAQNTRDRADQAYKRGVSAYTAATNQIIDTTSAAGLTKPEGVNYDGLWEDLMRTREAALATGVRAEDFDKELMGTLAAKSLEIGDHQILELLDRQLPGQSYKMSDLPEGRDLREKTKDSLTIMAIRRDEEGRKQQEAADKQLYNENLSTALTELTKDPNAEIPDEVLKRMEKTDPDVRLKIAGARKTLAESAGGVEDPAEIRDLYSRIMEGTAGKAQILKAVESGIIRKPETISALVSFSEKFDGDNGQAGGMMKSQTAKNIMDAIKQRTTPKDELNVFGQPGGMSDSGFAATTDFRRLLHQWSAENPGATQLQQEEAVQQLGNMVLKGISVGEGQTTQGNAYVRPGEALGPVPDGATTPEQQQQLLQQQQQTDGPVDGGAPLSVEEKWKTRDRQQPSGITPETTLETLAPEQRNLIEREATRLGVPPDLYLKGIIKKKQQLEQQEGQMGNSGNDNLTTGSTGAIEQALTQDQVGGILAQVGEAVPAIIQQGQGGGGDLAGAAGEQAAQVGGAFGGVKMTKLAGTLAKLAPGAQGPLLEAISSLSPETMTKFGVGSSEALSRFLAQTSHETQGFTKLTEGLTYKTAARLMAVWPKRFKTAASAAPYVRNPRALANKVYANRMGNGPESSGDGYNYRGRGIMQLTGKSNYEEIGKMIGVDLVANPDLVQTDPKIAVLSALAFWKLNKLDKITDFNALTKRINGGTVGLADRKKRYAQLLKAFA